MVRKGKGDGRGELLTTGSRQRIFGQPENALTRSPEGPLGRPLTARSLIASLLLGRHPPAAPSALLVRWCALFGVTDTSARVALTRMVQRGELESAGATYALAGRIRERQAEQDLALEPRLEPWRGEWLLAVVRPRARGADERVALRRELEHQRMVPVREGVWTRPDNLSGPMIRQSPQCAWWRGRPFEASDVQSILEAFELDQHAKRTDELHDRLADVTRKLPEPDVLAHAFVVGAAAAQHLRRDPLLPAELLPREWHADGLRLAYRTYRRAFDDAVADWVRATSP